MNQAETKAYVEAHGIVTLQADITHEALEARELLQQLGNKSGAIPFYVIFPADNPNKPILIYDPIVSPGQIIAKFKLAVGDKGNVPTETAMATPPN